MGKHGGSTGCFFKPSTAHSFGSCRPNLLQCWAMSTPPDLLACWATGQNGRPDPMDTSMYFNSAFKFVPKLPSKVNDNCTFIFFIPLISTFSHISLTTCQFPFFFLYFPFLPSYLLSPIIFFIIIFLLFPLTNFKICSCILS